MKIIAVTRKGINKTENEGRIVVGKSILAGGTLFAEMENGEHMVYLLQSGK